MVKKTKFKTRCSMCKTEFETKTYIQPNGMLKGYRIIEDLFCSTSCKKKFDKLIENAE